MSKWPSDLMTSARVVDGVFEFTTADSPVVQRRPLPIEPERRQRYRCAACGAGGAHPAAWEPPLCHRCPAGAMQPVIG